MSVQAVNIDQGSIEDVQLACSNAGSGLSESTTDVPSPSGSSEALAAFCDQAKKLNDLITRYGAAVTKDAGTLQDAIDQFEGWDEQTASQFHNN